MAEECITTSIKIKALTEHVPKCLEDTYALIHWVISFTAKMCYSTLLTAYPSEACSANTLASDVVAVCSILAVADFSTVLSVEP